MTKRVLAYCILIMLIILISCSGSKKAAQEVVIYTSLDQIFSEPILKEFERVTGIKVKTVYDVEASKTIGLVSRLIAEKDNPRCDVFWNSEICRTIILKQKGILARYISPASSDIPISFKDKEGYWAGFAARARVLVYNKNLVKNEDLPKSIFELTQPKWRSQVAMPNPLFGTTATHAAALFVTLGDEKAKEYFNMLKRNSVVIVDGNSTSRDRVASGLLKIGFTDTDDVNVAIEEGKNVGMVFPDENGIGTLLIPNTIGLIKNGLNPENGKKLIDFILSKEVERMLAFSGSLQIPLRLGVPKPVSTPELKDFKIMNVDYERVADEIEYSSETLKGILLK